MLCMENSLVVSCADGIIAHSLLQSTEDNYSMLFNNSVIQISKKKIILTSPENYEHNNCPSCRQGVTRI